MIVRGLTLHRPWDVAMRELGKPIENRPTRPPKALLGQLVALHSGKVWDFDGMVHIEQQTGITLYDSECPAGAITCVGRLAGYIRHGDDGQGFVIEAYSGYRIKVFQPDVDRWFFGRYGWLIYDRRAIEPVPCRGMQGLFPLPPEVERLVLERYQGALGRTNP